MALPNIFAAEASNEMLSRINNLTNETKGNWGKMNVGQVLAHLNVSYEMTYSDKYPKPNFFVKFLLKNVIKKIVTNEVPYKQNGQTAKEFIITDQKDFDSEKSRLIDFINKTVQLGEDHFDGKVSRSFGKMTKIEWNNMFYKHLNHHLTQFGV